MDFTVSTDHRLKKKRKQTTTTKQKQPLNEKIGKYSYLAKERKRLWNMSVTVIIIAIGTFTTVPKDLQRRLEGTVDQRKN